MSRRDRQSAQECTRRLRVAMLGLAVMLLAGWTILSRAAPATPTPEGVDQLGIGEWEAIWTRVLERHVDQAGRIDFAGLRADHADLDRVVGFIAAVDPASSPARFPSPASRLAYYINAYNALAMFGVLDANVPERFDALGRLWFFYLRGVTIGGRSTSLYRLENEVILPVGDPRAHFALNCMVVSCPRLPRVAFTAGRLDRALDQTARSFIAEDRNLHLDRQKRQVHLSAIFDFYTKDFLAQAPSLIAYVNRYRAEPIPLDYQVDFLEYDWTINDQARRGAGSAPITTTR
jgi:Protein of unknown function, DUF547